MVIFTSLSRALACAVAMQQAIDRHNRRGDDAPLSVRIGISTGEATEDDGDYFGDCVVEATRLCALADGSQILATEVVKLMAGRHATQEFVPVNRRLRAAPSSRALWYDPFVGCPAGRRDALEVGVVVQDHQARHLRGRRDDEIRDRQPMLTALGKRVLQLDGS